MKKLTSQIASVPDRENVVFEIFANNVQIAEISNEPGEGLKIEIYANPEKTAWELDFLEFKRLLDAAFKHSWWYRNSQ